MQALHPLLLAVAAAAPAASPLREADVALERACAARDVAAFRGLLDPEAWFADGPRFARGPPAVLEAWADLLRPGGPSLRWEPQEAFVSASGDLGWTAGRYRFTASAGDGGTRTSEGRYLTVWRRGGGGWRVLLDISLRPVRAAAGARAALRTVRSRAGDVEVEAGEVAGAGVYVIVRRRGADGALATAVETESVR